MLRKQRGNEQVHNRREQQIIELVAQGLTNRDIAGELRTTEYVIKNHLRTIYDKLGLWNRVELALWYEARQQENRMAAESKGGTFRPDSSPIAGSEIS
jgi:DNA-binding NarL/FixJ family response regulator